MKKILFLVAMHLLCWQMSYAQWKKIDMGLNISGAGPVMNLSDRILSGASNKLYYKLDNDTTWRPIEDNTYAIKKLWYITKAKGDTIIAFPNTYTNEKNSLFFSLDKGMTWNIQESIHPDNPRPDNIIFDADTIFVIGMPSENIGGNLTRIFSTSDLGKSYRGYQSPPTSFPFKYIAKIGNHLFIARQPIPSNPNDTSYVGVVRTTDDGKNWESVNNGLNPYITFLQKKDTMIYAGTYSGLFVSNNYGDEWSTVSGLPSTYAQFFDYEGKFITVCLNKQIYLSSDNGISWSNIGDEISMELADMNTSVTGLSIRNGKIYVSTTRGIFSTNDTGTHWKVERFQGANPGISAFESAASKLYAATQNFGIYQSSNNGSSWTRIDSNFSGEVTAAPSVSVLYAIDSSLYAIPFNANNLYTANLNTLEWKRMSNFNTPGWINSIIKFKDILVMSHSNGLFYSKDNGVSWLQNKDVFGASFKGRIYFDTLYIPSQSGLMYSTDGLIWNVLHSFPWFEVINYWKSSSIQIVKVLDKSAKSTTYFSWLSRDGGVTWDTLDFVAKDVLLNGMEILATVADKGLATGNGRGIAISKDEGRTWTFKNDGIDELDISRIYSVVVAGDTIFAYGASGIYKDALRNYITTSVQEEQEFVQNYFYHYPPYPLPASGQIQIKVYWGPDVELTAESIEIFTVLGEKVSVAPQDITISKQTASNGIITWNCRTMPPGAYVMKVQHGDKTSAIKFMLAK